MSKKGLNYKVLLIFAPVLILVGIAGFLVPADVALTSGAPAYNVFHIIFGLIGVWLLVLRNENYIRGFNIGFGLIDLYQAFAGYAHLFPEEHFRTIYFERLFRPRHARKPNTASWKTARFSGAFRRVKAWSLLPPLCANAKTRLRSV